MSVDVLGYFSLSNTTRSNINLQFFEAKIRSNGIITRPVVRDRFGGRRYTFVVTVSFAIASENICTEQTNRRVHCDTEGQGYDDDAELLGMCGIYFYISVRFPFGFFKNSYSARNEFCSVRFKKRHSVRILQLFTTHVIADNTATVDDMTLTSLMSLTTMTTGK